MVMLAMTSTKHIRGARAIFAMRPSYNSLAHNMASTTIHGAPVKRGIVPSGLTAYVPAYSYWALQKKIPYRKSDFAVSRRR